ncbi:MAG: PilZ domain-containing protein [Candidatus Acidiferrales bacterium]
MATAVHRSNVPDRSATTPDNSKKVRRRERLKISLPLQVQPFDARFSGIVDVGEVIDFSRDGLYFATCMPHYFVGMRLLMTFPFGQKASTRKKFLAVILRMENRPEGSVGIAVRFLL